MPQEQEYTNQPSGGRTDLPPLLWALIGFGGSVICLVSASVITGLVSDQGVLAAFGWLFHPGHQGFVAAILLPPVGAGAGWWVGWTIREERRRRAALDFRLGRKQEELATVQTQLEDAHEEIAYAKEKFLRTTTRMRLRLARMLSPAPVPKRVDLFDIIDTDILQDLQDAFAVAFGLSSEVRDLEAELLTRPSNTADVCSVVRSSPLGKQECFWFTRNIVEKAASRKRPVFKKCPSCGLLCGGSPVVIDDHHVATWMAGQVRTDETDEAVLKSKADELGLSATVLLGAHRAAPAMTQGAYEAALGLLWFITREISSMGYNNLKLAREAILRMRAEREARLSWHALDQVKEGIVLADPNGKIMVANEAFCRQLQSSRSDLQERKLRDLRPDSCAPGEDFLAASESGPISLRRPGGDNVPLSVVRSEVTMGDKTFVCLKTLPTEKQTAADSMDLSDY